EKLYTKDMSMDQLEEVWEANGHIGSDLHDEVFDDMQDELMSYVGEILDTLEDGLSSWSIGFCNRSQHITAKENYSEFIEAVKKMQRCYCFLPDKYDEKIEYIDGLNERLNEMNIDNKQYDNLEEKVGESIKEIEDDITSQFTELLDGNIGNERDHFLNFYADCRLEGDEYVWMDDNNESDWTL